MRWGTRYLRVRHQTAGVAGEAFTHCGDGLSGARGDAHTQCNAAESGRGAAGAIASMVVYHNTVARLREASAIGLSCLANGSTHPKFTCGDGEAR